MIIVAGHLMIEPSRRAAYLLGCADVVAAARSSASCLDFAIGGDLLDPSRVNVYERWESQEAVEAFRGGGPSDDQGSEILSVYCWQTDRQTVASASFRPVDR